MVWALAEAKNKFSELVRRALEYGPQKVTRRGEAVIVISEADYLKLTGDRSDEGRDSLAAFLLAGPSLDGLDLERDASPPRDSGL